MRTKEVDGKNDGINEDTVTTEHVRIRELGRFLDAEWRSRSFWGFGLRLGGAFTILTPG